MQVNAIKQINSNKSQQKLAFKGNREFQAASDFMAHSISDSVFRKQLLESTTTRFVEIARTIKKQIVKNSQDNVKAVRKNNCIIFSKDKKDFASLAILKEKNGKSLEYFDNEIKDSVKISVDKNNTISIKV